MDRRVIDEKLESLRRCVDRIRSRCPEDSSLLVSDLDLQDIISLNLTRAVQICVDIAAIVISESPLPAPDTMGAAFEGLAELALSILQAASRGEITPGEAAQVAALVEPAVAARVAVDWTDRVRDLDKKTP